MTSLIEPPDIILATGERLAAPPHKPRWHPWAWGAALVLHALVLALALYTRAQNLPQAQAPASFSVVFDNGGAKQNTAPPAPNPGPSQPAQAPAIPPPPTPPTQTQPEVNLDVPQNLLATLPPPPPHPVPQARPHPHPAPPHYAMMLNGMSYGSPSSQLPTPPAPPGTNMSLPQSDAQAVMGPEFTVKGDIGSDWMSSLNKWVNAHAYYPAAAAEQGQQGNAEVEFDVDRQGNVSKLRMITSSGSTFLDQAWYGIFQGAQLPPFPANTKSDHVTVDYTIHYILEP